MCQVLSDVTVFRININEMVSVFEHLEFDGDRDEVKCKLFLSLLCKILKRICTDRLIYGLEVTDTEEVTQLSRRLVLKFIKCIAIYSNTISKHGVS